jgi:hypothetical protein
MRHVSCVGVCVLAAGAAVATWAHEARADGPEATVAGLQVVHKDVGGAFGAFRPFNSQRGTQLVLVVNAPAGGLIEFDSKASQVTKLTDNKGTDLLAKPKKRSRFSFSSSPFGMFNRVSKDAKAAMIVVKGGGVPAKGATSIHIDATLVFQSATGKRTVKKPLALAIGATVTVLGVTLTVTKVGKPKWSMGDAKYGVSFQVVGPAKTVADIRFLAPGGAAVKSRRSSTMRMGSKITWAYSMAKKLEKATLVIDLWEGQTELKVPIKASVTLGG